VVIRKSRLIIPSFEDIAGDQDDAGPAGVAGDPASHFDDSPVPVESHGVTDGLEPAYRQPTGAPEYGQVPASGGSTVCTRCRRPLTSPESIARGMGPRCADLI
jgi:hypothetical protein